MFSFPMAGALTGFISGAFVGVLLLFGAMSARAEADMLVFFGLALPLAFLGLVYDYLKERGWRVPGRYSGILYWGVSFPVAKLIHLLMVQGRLLVSQPLTGGSGAAVFSSVFGLVEFLLYQAMFGLAYGVGFMVLYRQVSGSLSVRKRSA